MFPRALFPASFFAPGYFPPVVAALLVPMGAYPGPVPRAKRPDYRGRLKARRKGRKEEEEILFWLMVEALTEDE